MKRRDGKSSDPWFGVGARSRREADLFFAELMGTRRRRAPAGMPAMDVIGGRVVARAERRAPPAAVREAAEAECGCGPKPDRDAGEVAYAECGCGSTPYRDAPEAEAASEIAPPVDGRSGVVARGEVEAGPGLTPLATEGEPAEDEEAAPASGEAWHEPQEDDGMLVEAAGGDEALREPA